MSPRVFVTGLGVVSSVGLGREAFFRALESGTSGISPVASFDAVPAGPRKRRRGQGLRRSRPPHARRAAADGSMLCDGARSRPDGRPDAELLPSQLAGPRTAVVLGTTMGEAQNPRRARARVDSPGSAGRLPGPHPSLRLDAPAHPRGARARRARHGAHAAGGVRCGQLRDRLRVGPDPRRPRGRGRDGRRRAPSRAAVQRLRAPGGHGPREVPALRPEPAGPSPRRGRGAPHPRERGARRAPRRPPSRGGRSHGLSCDAYHITRPHPDAVGSIVGHARGHRALGNHARTTSTSSTRTGRGRSTTTWRSRRSSTTSSAIGVCPSRA